MTGQLTSYIFKKFPLINCVADISLLLQIFVAFIINRSQNIKYAISINEGTHCNNFTDSSIDDPLRA